MWQKFTEDFYFNFIEKDRWLYLVDGLKITLTVTLLAVILGIVIGLIVGVIRSTYEKTHKLKILNFICNLYLTVIRGTPVVVQLMIIYYVIFGSLRVDKVPVAVLAFGINSGAYVAEIFRSGIMSIDNGQFEAGRSLGFNYPQTMWYIIMPQAFKRIIPPLGNEFIAMLKDSSLVSVIGFEELTRTGQMIISRTYAVFEVWMVVAILYLIMTLCISRLVAVLEKRFNTSKR